jgi:hypothetical protein
MTQAYPLQWPAHKKRCQTPASAQFKTTFEKARRYLTNELKLLNASYPVISTNIPLRRDGFPYADHKPPQDRGVAIYFQYNGQAMCFACDRWDRVEHNLQAIGHTIAALRGIARWGTGDMLEAAFSGFTALPAPDSGAQWAGILGVHPNAPIGIIEEAYRNLARLNHPDRGGSAEKMAELNAAIAQARREKGAA